MKVRYSETALAEINEIFAYISEQNAPAAKRVVARIERTINNLGDFPEMAQETREPGVRRIPAGRYPYLVYYTVEAEEVVICTFATGHVAGRGKTRIDSPRLNLQLREPRIEATRCAELRVRALLHD